MLPPSSRSTWTCRIRLCAPVRWTRRWPAGFSSKLYPCRWLSPLCCSLRCDGFPDLRNFLRFRRSVRFPTSCPSSPNYRNSRYQTATSTIFASSFTGSPRSPGRMFRKIRFLMIANMLDEHLLERVQVAVALQPLNSGDLMAIVHRHESHTGQNPPAFDVDCTRPAFPAIARFLLA